MPLYRHRAKLW